MYATPATGPVTCLFARRAEEAAVAAAAVRRVWRVHYLP